MQQEEEEERKKRPAIAEEDKEKPNFGLSGSLAAETNTTVSGAVLKYNEPPEARKPSQKWRLYVFKGDKEIGKEEQTKDSITTTPFIIDLASANGTFVNGAQIPATRYYELKLSDVIKFGASTREFVLLHESAEV
ncbi:Smad nuclear-interacting protein 1 [Podila horticola]|nr:Smad nuclear-interacting protein 1 [Podila horticola]